MIKLRTAFIALVLLSASTGKGFSQWVLMSTPTGINYTRVQCFVGSGTNLFAGTVGVGVWLSTNNGTGWTAVNTGMTNRDVRSLVVSGTNLFAGTADGGVFLSTNNGTGWTAVNTGLTNTNVQSLAISGTNIFAGTAGGGVFLSSNNGASWTAASTGLTSTFVNALAVSPGGGSGANLFAGTMGVGGVWLSTNNGTGWTAVNTGLTNTDIQSLVVAGTNLIAVTAGGGVFLSTNNGAGWTPASTGLPTSFERHLAASGTNVFAGNYGTGYYVTTNNGTSWNPVNSSFTNTHFVRALAVFGSYLFAAHYNGDILRRPLSEMVTSVRQATNETRADFALAQNYPNPFNPNTMIRFSLPKAEQVTLTILDVLGQEVAQPVSQFMNAGTYTAEWNASGFASGVYYYRLDAGGFAETKKLVLLR